MYQTCYMINNVMSLYNIAKVSMAMSPVYKVEYKFHQGLRYGQRYIKTI